MRQLTKKQKQFLDKWYQDNKHNYNGLAVGDVSDLLTPDEWQTLVDMNDTEILSQNINRYVNDLCSKDYAEKGWQ